jgi:hypothetical protein
MPPPLPRPRGLHDSLDSKSKMRTEQEDLPVRADFEDEFSGTRKPGQLKELG